jgi:chromate reductase
MLQNFPVHEWIEGMRQIGRLAHKNGLLAKEVRWKFLYLAIQMNATARIGSGPMMTQALHIVGVCGSLRAESYSHVLLQAIAELLPVETRFYQLDIGEIPHYNEDYDGRASPNVVTNARTAVERADAVIIVTPEFNHGIPGVLKNALDWLSRPAFASCFVGKPVLFATASPGALGGVRAQYQLRETLSSMLCRLFPLAEIAVTHINRKLDGARLADEATLNHIGMVLNSFLKQAELKSQAEV